MVDCNKAIFKRYFMDEGIVVYISFDHKGLTYFFVYRDKSVFNIEKVCCKIMF